LGGGVRGMLEDTTHRDTTPHQARKSGN